MWNIIIGIIFIIGGLSGKLVLRGTNSGMALAALGGALVIWGIIQLVKTKRNTGE
jgi:predicted phage tail protein